MLSKLLVGFYRVVHGKLHWRGAGWLVKRAARLLPGLQCYPLAVGAEGTAMVDFRDAAAFLHLNATLGDVGENAAVLQCLEAVLQPGDVFWDVGASVGLVSARFADPRYKLYSLRSFEPNPAPRKTLESLLAKSPVAAIHPFGLGDKDQTMTMSLSAVNSELSSLAEDWKEGLTIPVQIRSGDSLRLELQLPAPNVIKIDVEGFEPQVFAGLARTISQHHPIIIFEHHYLPDEKVKQLIPPDYLVYFLGYDGSASPDIAARKAGRDAILIPVEKAHLFSPEKRNAAKNQGPCPGS